MIKLGNNPEVIEPNSKLYCKKIKNFIFDSLDSYLESVIEEIEKFGNTIGCEKNPKWVVKQIIKIIRHKRRIK